MTRVDWEAYELPISEIIMPFFDNVDYILEDEEYKKLFFDLITDKNFDILNLVYLDETNIVGEKLYKAWLNCGKNRNEFVRILDSKDFTSILTDDSEHKNL